MADIFVIADDYQFTTNHQINRTRIKTAEGPSWLTVPVLTKGRHRLPINQVRINNQIGWREKHIRTLSINYAYAAYFDQYRYELNAIYERQWDCLVDLNMTLLEFIIASIGLHTQIIVSSELQTNGHGSHRLRQMLERLNCEVYLAGKDLYNHLNGSDYFRNGFKVEFVGAVNTEYHQQFGAFINNLSFIDLLFNEGPDCVKILKQPSGRSQ